MHNLLDLLVSYYNFSLKQDAYYSISLYLLNNLNKIDYINLKDIASACYTSSSTINKFCEMFGFSNFNAFKHQLKSALYMKKTQVTARHKQMNLHNSYLTYLSCCHDDKQISEEEFIFMLEAIADEIYQSKQVIVYGSVFPSYLVSNFQTDMCLTGKFIKNYYAWNKENANSIDDNTLLFFISYTGTHLSTRTDIFIPLIKSTAKKVYISQRDYSEIPVTNLVKSIVLPNQNDCVELNYVLLVLFDIIRWCYFEKYYFNKE